MSSGIPGKIVLKSTTKISLTERFAGIRQNAAVYQQNAQQVKVLRPGASQLNGTGFRGPLGEANARDRMRQETLASQKSQRLAQQMSQRPAVVAALKLKQRSIRHRLGYVNDYSQRNGDVRSRLSLPVQSRLGGGGLGGYGYNYDFSDVRTRGRGRGWGGRGFRGRGNRGNQRSRSRGRGGYRGFRGSRGGFRGGRGGRRGGQGRGGPTRLRGFRSFRGRGRGRGAPRVSKETLDQQLDQYMAKSRGALDSELDAYMALTDD